MAGIFSGVSGAIIRPLSQWQIPTFFPNLDQKLPNQKVIFSSPEPLGSQGELIVYPSSRRPSVRRPSASVVVRPPFLKIFSSETAWPIKAKFYVELPWEGGTKVCINGPGHMTKMAAMPIYDKNL